jgi:tyrosine-protein phosphatase SIW14
MLMLSGRSITTALILALISLSVYAQQQGPPYRELPNFHQVNDHLYRGGQPKKGGLKKLADLGIKTIINLRGDSEDTLAEEAEAKRLGFLYYNIPMSSIGRPTDEQISKVIEIIDLARLARLARLAGLAGNAPVFIHCRRGSDRTGVIIAIYRMMRDCWTAERALQEAKRYGMGWIQFRKRDYIKDFFEERFRWCHNVYPTPIQLSSN